MKWVKAPVNILDTACFFVCDCFDDCPQYKFPGCFEYNPNPACGPHAPGPNSPVIKSK